MAAPTYVAAGTASVGTGAVTPGLPTGHTTNDILLCFVQSSNEAISVPTNATSGTWAEVTGSPVSGGTAASAGACRLGVFWMRDPGTTIGTVTVADTGNHTVASIACFRGCVTTGNPWSGTPGTSAFAAIANSAWGTLPDVTTVDANTLPICVVGNSLDSNSTPFTAGDFTATNVASPTGGTVLAFASGQTNSGTGGGVSFIAVSGTANLSNTVLPNAGHLSTGANGSTSGIVDPAWETTSTGGCNWVGLTLALKPPPPAVTRRIFVDGG
jgi:hypothetical protein